MSRKATNDDLIRSVRLRCFTPTSQGTFSDADILMFAQEELHNEIVPTIRNVRAHFFEASSNFSLNGATNGFSIPDRAVGAALSRLYWLLADGTQGGEVSLGAEGGGSYLRNNKVYLTPFPYDGSAANLQMVYYLRPGDLVPTTEARKVASFTSTSITLTSNLATLTTGGLFDIVDQKSPYVYKLIDQVGTVAGAVLSGLSTTAGVAVGDWVTLAGESPIPQIPYDFHPVLRARAAARLLEATGDRPAMAIALQSALSMEAKLIQSIKPRLDDQPNYIVTDFPWRGASGRRF